MKATLTNRGGADLRAMKMSSLQETLNRYLRKIRISHYSFEFGQENIICNTQGV